VKTQVTYLARFRCMLSSCEFDYYHTLNLHLKILPQYLYIYIFLLTSSHLTSISLLLYLFFVPYIQYHISGVCSYIHVNVHNNMIRNLYTLGFKIRRNFSLCRKSGNNALAWHLSTFMPILISLRLFIYLQ